MKIIFFGILLSNIAYAASSSGCDLHSFLENKNANNTLTSAIAILQVKERAGWVKSGIKNAETVWEHSSKVAKAAKIFFERRYPRQKKYAAHMGQFHDLGEFKVPDYTPHDKITNAEKHQQEENAILELFNNEKQNPKKIKKILESWREYEEGETLVAKLVFDLDKMDAAIQALVYKNHGHDVEEFFPYSLGKVTDPELWKILDYLIKKNQ
jgi:5'-deoxynucleotidase YfbR-like HD superfamily hydrolase